MTTRELAAAYRRACESKDAAYHALVASLSENHRKALDYLHKWTTPQGCYSITIEVAFKWSPEYASSILNELADFGLLELEEVLTDSGREFRYRLAK